MLEEEAVLNVLKEKAQSIRPLYVEVWFDMIRERIEAAAAMGALRLPCQRVWRVGWSLGYKVGRGDEIPDFIRGANKSHGFFSYTSRTHKNFCLMAYNIEGKSACLIYDDDYEKMAYPARQRLDAYLTEVQVAIFQEVAQRLIQAGYTLSLATKPESRPQNIRQAETELEDDTDEEYELYMKVSWTRAPHQTPPTPKPDPPTNRSFWHRVIGE